MSDAQQKTISEKIDEIFDEWDQPDTPGAAAIVIRDGDVVHKRGYGSAQLEYCIPITPSTVFHVASVSKQFTCMAVLLLADDGKLSPEDDITKHLPWVPDFGQTITIEHLMHHTSGLRDQWELLRLAGWRMDDVITTEHIRKMVRHQQQLNFPPGEKHLYSNTGYTLLAEIVGEVSGQSLREFAAERIFGPLDMTSTHFHHDHREIVKDRAYSYSENPEDGYRKSVLSYANVGATSLFTTVEDLARWLSNFDSLKVGDEKLMQRMHQRFVLNDGETISYACGLTHGEHRGLSVVGHSGGDAGFRSWCGRFTDHGVGVAVLSNLASFNPHSLAMQIGELLLGDHTEECKGEEKRQVESALPTQDELAECTGTYLLSPYGLLEISLAEDRLQLERGNQPAAALVPVRDLEFDVEDSNQSISFCRDEDGCISGIELSFGGRQMNAERIQLPQPDSQKLAEYQGVYTSDELGTRYRLVAEDGALIMRHRRHDDVTLQMIENDVFHGRGRRPGKVTFTRDDARIDGFKIDGGRVHGLRFVRQD